MFGQRQPNRQSGPHPARSHPRARVSLADWEPRAQSLGSWEVPSAPSSPTLLGGSGRRKAATRDSRAKPSQPGRQLSGPQDRRSGCSGNSCENPPGSLAPFCFLGEGGPGTARPQCERAVRAACPHGTGRVDTRRALRRRGLGWGPWLRGSGCCCLQGDCSCGAAQRTEGAAWDPVGRRPALLPRLQATSALPGCSASGTSLSAGTWFSGSNCLLSLDGLSFQSAYFVLLRSTHFWPK